MTVLARIIFPVCCSGRRAKVSRTSHTLLLPQILLR